MLLAQLNRAWLRWLAIQPVWSLLELEPTAPTRPEPTRPEPAPAEPTRTEPFRVSFLPRWPSGRDLLVDVLRRGIERGDIPAGAMLPGGSAIAAHYHVEVKTVRRATDQLRAQGLLVTRGVPGTMGGNRVCVADDAPGLARTA